MSAGRIKDLDLLRTRALLILQRKLHGMTHKAIAKEFNVSEEIVRREILRAKRLDLLRTFDAQIIEDLIPGAIKAYKDALAKGDTVIAEKVFKGLGFLLPPSEKQPTSEDPDTLEFYFKQRRGTNAGQSQNTSSLPPAGTVRALPRSSAEDATERPEAIEAEILTIRSEAGTSDSD